MGSRDTEHRVPTVYTQAQLNYLSKNRTLTRSLLTIKFNKRFKSNKSIIAITALCKRLGWFTGRTGYFEKGQKPWNTGTKGICKRNAGCFRKGYKPKNWKPVGSERINTDSYVLIKTAEPNVWKFKHQLLWESKYGKVKKGDIIQFKDHNKLNCNLDNLEKVSRQVGLFLNRHGYAELPMKLKQTMKAIAEVETKIFERQKTVNCRKIKQKI